jgi:hypothetical protein
MDDSHVWPVWFEGCRQESVGISVVYQQEVDVPGVVDRDLSRLHSILSFQDQIAFLL